MIATKFQGGTAHCQRVWRASDLTMAVRHMITTGRGANDPFVVAACERDYQQWFRRPKADRLAEAAREKYQRRWT